MRSVKSTIAAAGLLKRNNQDGNESEIVLKALMDINLPKFLQQDIQLFTNIISDLFPTTLKPVNALGQLNSSITESMKDMELEPIPEFIDKVYQIYDTMEIRHAIMLVGPTGAGKTASYRVLEKAISRLAPQINDTAEQVRMNPYRHVKSYILNPKSVLNEQI